MAKSVKSFIKKVIGFGILGMIAALAIVGVVDWFLHYNFKRSLSYYGGFTVKEETVAGRECFCFYMNDRRYTSSWTGARDRVYFDEENLRDYERYYVTLGSNLLAGTYEGFPSFFVMDKKGEKYGGVWLDSPRFVKNCVYELYYVNPDGSEELLWRNEEIAALIGE